MLAILLAAALAANPTQFVDKSYISLPKSAGEFTLRSFEYDPKAIATGVSSNYKMRDAPDGLTINLYVFPQGDGKESEIVESQVDGADAVIRQQSDYTDIVAGERRSIVVDAPQPTMPGSGGRKIRMTFGQSRKISLEEARRLDAADVSPDEAITEMRAPTQSHGRWQGYTLSIRGGPARSATIVFHRQLYNIKLRISVPAASVDQPAFDAIAQSAAKALVPKVDIRNLGTCANIVLFAQDSGDDKLDQAATERAIFRAQGTIQRNNCAPSDDDKPEPALEGYERAVIVFPPDTWQ